MKHDLIDLKDRQILYELDKNSRESSVKIAKKLKLSPEVVNYRIKQLEKRNIIKQYQIIAHLSKLGIIQFKICLSLQYLTSSELDSIIQKLKKQKEIKWIVSSKGVWDLLISVETTSLSKVDELKNNILSLFEHTIHKKAFSIMVESHVFNRDYLIKKKSFPKEKKISMKESKMTNVDDTDIKILKILSTNSRASIIDLANELSISPRIVQYRIKKLRKKEIITGFKIALNYERIGIQFYKVFLYLNNYNKKEKEILEQYLSQHPNVIHYVKVLGNWDLEPEFEVYSEKEFDTILTSIKDKFSNIIQKMDIVKISKEHKFVYL